MQAEVCWVDEPADGLGPRGPNFCSGSGGGGGADSNPVDFKRITITTSWNTTAGAGHSRHSTLISSRGGDGDAPAIEPPRLVSPAVSPITSPATTSASFAVTTLADAARSSGRWTATSRGPPGEAARTGPSAGSCRPLDGVYDVSAQSFGASGSASEPRSTTVVVNRYAPLQPTNFNAGRNGTVVEAEWTANKELDIIGYKLYRSENGGPAARVPAHGREPGASTRRRPSRTASRPGDLDVLGGRRRPRSHRRRPRRSAVGAGRGQHWQPAAEPARQPAREQGRQRQHQLTGWRRGVGGPRYGRPDPLLPDLPRRHGGRRTVKPRGRHRRTT